MKHTAIYFGHAGAASHSGEVEAILRLSFNLVFAQNFAFADQDCFNQARLSHLEADFLFSFGPLIVKRPLLDSIRLAAINFHPAPPRWPGRGSASMALLHGDEQFGVTAHIMHAEIDSGPILKVLRFPILEEDDAETLRQRAFSHIPELAGLSLEDLRQNDWQAQPGADVWERKAIRKEDVIKMLRIAETDSDEIIGRKMKASAGHESTLL